MLKALQKIFGNREDQPVVRLYNSVVNQARMPWFYAELDVPDSVDGRFDLIVLHAFLLMRRLGQLGPAGQQLSQEVFDLFIGDMDRNMREMGVGDLGVGKKVKAMARGFFGRVAAYDTALNANDLPGLGEALRRNVYGTAADTAEPAKVEALANYCVRCMGELEGQNSPELLAGQVRWPSVS